MTVHSSIAHYFFANNFINGKFLQAFYSFQRVRNIDFYNHLIFLPLK